MQRREFRSLGLVRQIGIVAVALFLVAVPSWRWWQTARNGELQLLYASALTGNLESVKKISSYRLSGGTAWLESPARDRNADAYARVAAIDQLTDSRSLNRRALVPLLWIDVPFVVRQKVHISLQRGAAMMIVSG